MECQFVREFVTDLVDSAGNTKTSDEDVVAASPSCFMVSTGDGSSQLFIDMGVYTRNRMFRVLGSSKYRKQAVLRVVKSPLSPDSAQQAPLADEFDRDAFVASLVCPFPSMEAMELETNTRPVRLLRCAFDRNPVHRLGRWTSHRPATSTSVECRQSVFPKLDAFIRGQATTGGVQGEIRSIQMLFPMQPVHLEAGNDTAQSEHDPSSSDSRPWMITYHMARNRWCGNIRRAHRSNNVMYIVDLEQRVYYQKCHDPVCQALDYRYAQCVLNLHILFSLC